MIRSLLRNLIIGLFAFSLINSNSALASEGQGAPIGEPGAVSEVSVGAFSSGSTNTTISWKIPTSNGGSAILGYTATAMYGASFGTEGVFCTASQPANAIAGTTVASCEMVGLSYSTLYRIKVVARNAVGSGPAANSTEFTISASNSQTVTIDNAPSSVAFGSATTQLQATVSSGRSITWSTSTDSICSVSNSGLVTYLSVGTCTIKATQDGTGSSYQTAFDQESISVTASVSVTASSATGITGSGATLRGSVPYPGSDAAVVFCISLSNSTSSCTAPTGVSLSTASPATITSNSGSATSALASGLSSNTTYYYWLEATVNGVVIRSSTSSFTTFSAPVIALDGPTTGEQNSPFSTNVVASGGSGVFVTWGATSLPTGLTLTPSGTQATISGTPAVAGSFNSEVSVTDSNGVRAVLAINFTINQPLTPPTQSDNDDDFDTTNEPVDPEKQKAAEEAAKQADAAAKLAAEEAAKKAAEEAAKKAAQELIEKENAARTEASTPVLSSDGKPPKLEDKSPETTASATLAGKIVSSQIFVDNLRTITITVGDQTIILQGQAPNGDIRDTTPNGVLKVVQEDVIKVQGFGLRPNSKATVWIFSTPTKLGEITVKSDGTYLALVKVPSTINVGDHTVQVNGVTDRGEVLSFSLLLIVIPKESSSTDSGEKAPLNPGSSDNSNSQSGSGSTKNLLVKKYAIFLATGKSSLVNSEKERVVKLRQIIRKASNVTCVTYTKKKSLTKKERKVLLSQASAVCAQLSTKKFPIKSKISVAQLSKAPKIKRIAPQSRKVRVDIRYSIPTP